MENDPPIICIFLLERKDYIDRMTH